MHNRNGNILKKISIIIRTLNEEKYLGELLEKIKCQKIQDYIIQIVIVDSGSTDNTLLIAKKFNAKILYYLTFLLEKLVFKYANLSTVVSKIEKNKIRKIYSLETIIFPNAILLNNKYKKKIKKRNYIIFSGSYLYKPNRHAIDFLIKNMPKIRRKFSSLKLIITGGGYNDIKFPWLINKGIVNKKKLYELILNSKLVVVPLKFGTGTRIKILEALCLGSIVVSSKKGIEGINFIKKNPPFVYKNTSEFFKIIESGIKNNKKLFYKAQKYKNYFIREYTMQNQIKKFINENVT